MSTSQTSRKRATRQHKAQVGVLFLCFFPWQTPTCVIYVQYKDESVFQRRGRDASIQTQTQQRARVRWQESSRCNRSRGAVHMP